MHQYGSDVKWSGHITGITNPSRMDRTLPERKYSYFVADRWTRRLAKWEMPKLPDYPRGEQFYTDAVSGFGAQCGLRTAARRAEMTHVSEQSTTFNPETLHILGSALDDAWQRLEVRVHLNGSGDAIRTILAKHIIAMAEQGERDRQRLIEGALARLKLW
jgi:hypothetical protein